MVNQYQWCAEYELAGLPLPVHHPGQRNQFFLPSALTVIPKGASANEVARASSPASSRTVPVPGRT